MDIFCEYMVSKRKGTKEFLMTIGILFVAIFLTMLVLMFWQFLSAVAFLIVVGIWYGAIFLLRKTNVEYEYILTNEFLDIDKIMAKQSRKRMLTINLKEIDNFKKKTSADLQGGKILDYTACIEADNIYIIETQKDGERVKIFFQPNEKMLGSMHKSNPKLIPEF